MQTSTIKQKNDVIIHEVRRNQMIIDKVVGQGVNRAALFALAILFTIGQVAWAQPGSGILPAGLDVEGARITDVGVAIRDIEAIVKTDSVTQRSDTLLFFSEPEILWQSENINVYDSLSVDRAMQPRRAERRKILTDKGIYQSGNMMPDVFTDFYYYVFRFEYQSVDAGGNPIMLSAIAACPPKWAGSEVNNIVIGTHITITSDAERPSAQINGFDKGDWGMLLSLAGTGKFLLKSEYRTTAVIASEGLIAAGAVCAIIPGVGWVIGGALAVTGGIIGGIVAIEQAYQSTDSPDYNCNLVVMADYEGYGLTKGRAHPYLYQELTARQCVDATRYARYLYEHDSNLDWLRLPLRKKFRTFSCGYSQGGSVAMAVHRFVEQNNLTDELHFVGSICGDGPYDPISTLMFYMRQDLEGKNMSMPVVLPLIVKGMLDTNPYMVTHKADEYFRPEFLQTGIMDWLASKECTTGDIDRLWREYHSKNPSFKNYQSCSVRDIMNDECYAYFLQLYQQNKNTYTQAAGIPLPQHRGVMEDLHLALASNDMTKGWTPKHSLLLFHSRGDNVVPYDNAVKAKNAFGSKVTLEDAPNGLDHGDSGLDFFRGDSNLDVGARITSTRLNDNVSTIAGKDW